MTLRSDIHELVDQEVPPAPWLARNVSEAVFAGRPHEKLSRRVVTRLGGFGRAAGLVAAPVAALLIVAILLGTRGWFGLNHHPAQPAAGVDQTALASLRERPFQTAVLAPGQACPIHAPLTAILYSGALQDVHGEAPVYFTSAIWTQSTAWGGYQETAWFVEKSVTGPVLVRARDLTTGDDLVFTGGGASGPVLGMDTLEGKRVELRTELVLDASHRPAESADNGRLSVWYSVDGKADTSPHCEAWQIDGAGFSKTFVLYWSAL